MTASIFACPICAKTLFSLVEHTLEQHWEISIGQEAAQLNERHPVRWVVDGTASGVYHNADAIHFAEIFVTPTNLPGGVATHIIYYRNGKEHHRGRLTNPCYLSPGITPIFPAGKLSAGIDETPNNPVDPIHELRMTCESCGWESRPMHMEHE